MSDEKQPEYSNDAPTHRYPDPNASAAQDGPEAQAGCGPADDRGAANQAQAPAGVCPDCQGSGQILLLISTRLCQTCGGTGLLAAPVADAGSDANPAPANAAPPQGVPTYVYRYDDPAGPDQLRAAGATAAVPCPACGGAGKLDLLTTTPPCHTCGSGSITTVPQTWRSAYYFEQGTGRFLGQEVLP